MTLFLLFFLNGTPDRIRTYGLWLRKPTLYEPVAQPVAGAVVEGPAAFMHAQARRLPHHDDARRFRGLEDGARLMGFGHRIYRTRDPRADVLKAALQRLAPDTPRLDFAMKVERAAQAKLAARHKGRALDTNVEFYTALLLDALGVPRALFTPVFAMGRVAGWTAHAIEHHARKGRLIRPDSIYDGAMP